MQQTIVTLGVPYAQLLADLAEIFRRETKASSQPAAGPAVGGIALGCEVTGLSKARIYALVSAREIPHAKRGNKLYFNRAELEAWIAEGKRGGSISNEKAH